MNEESIKNYEQLPDGTVFVPFADEYPTREEADALFRSMGRDPADVGKIGELIAKVAMLEHDLKESHLICDKLQSLIETTLSSEQMFDGCYCALCGVETRTLEGWSYRDAYPHAPNCVSVTARAELDNLRSELAQITKGGES